MNIHQFIKANHLQPADVIVLKKKFLGMVDHFAVFLGWNANTLQPLFAANYTKGTQIISHNEIGMFTKELEPQKIERFTGNTYERQAAVKRALLEIGKNDYNYFTNNCEHYKNFVQSGKKYSEQVEEAKNALVVACIGLVFITILDSLMG